MERDGSPQGAHRFLWMPFLWIATAFAFAAGSRRLRPSTKRKPTGTVLVSMADNSYSPAIVRSRGRIHRVHERRPQRAQRLCRRQVLVEREELRQHQTAAGRDDEIVLTKEGVYPFYCTFHGTPDGKAAWSASPSWATCKYTPPSGARGYFVGSREAERLTRRVPQATRRSERVDAAESRRPGPDRTKATTTEAVFVTHASVPCAASTGMPFILDGKFELGTGHHGGR